MAIKWKSNKDKSKGMIIVLLCAILSSTVMCNAYPYFRNRARQNIEEYQKNEKKTEDLFYVDEAFERYLLSSIYYMNYETTPDMDAYTYLTQGYDMNKLSDDERKSIREASNRLMKNMRNQYTTMQSMNNYSSYASNVEKDYGTDGNLHDAMTGNAEFAREYYQSGIVISYDSRGVPSIRLSWNMDLDESKLLGYLQQASMSRLMADNGMDYEAVPGDYTGEYAYELTEDMEEISYEKALNNDELLKQIPVPAIQNASFAFGIYGDAKGHDTWENYWMERNAYMMSGYVVAIIGIIMFMAAAALVLQNIPELELRKKRLFCLPTELTAWAGFLGIAVTTSFLPEFGFYTIGGEIVDDCRSMGFGNASAQASAVFIWAFWACFAFCWYWLTASVLPYITHPIRTLKDHMLCISVCRWGKNLWLRIWRWATDVEVDEKLTRNIWKAVGLNGVVVILLCCTWFAGIVGTVIYSILLYILVKKKCGQIQENYQSLLHVTRTIAEGDLNTPTDEDMGLFNPVRDELTSIQNGFRKAVNEEVRSRNMKTELITNVSHDLKTPLTAIITYVDLLKKEDITEEERKDYIDTLDKKSQRLKVLIEDLFEVSKATTDNITMNFDEVDLVSLIKQVRLENEDKIQESTLDFRWNLPEEKSVLSLDAQRTFRIIDNLVQNALKYSMPHSRVYIELKDMGGEVFLSFKNMSAAEMNFSPEEITERFVRGDLSRNTEGSGLGLAIAQSFTELQNGTFKVETDGDLFKVLIHWKK